MASPVCQGTCYRIHVNNDTEVQSIQLNDIVIISQSTFRLSFLQLLILSPLLIRFLTMILE
jgi:hypothetical protein